MRPMLARGAALLLSLIVAAPLRAQTGAAPAGGPALEETTRIEGTVPDLTGRWLAVAEIALPDGGGKAIPAPQLWEVRAEGGKTTLSPRDGRLPQPLSAAIAAANAEHRGWEPSIADLQRLRDEWQRLEPEGRELAAVETVIIGRDAFSDQTKADEKMRDARFVIQQNLSYRPGVGRPIKDTILYGAMAPAPLGYSGNYASVTLAAAPFPVTIPLSGSFHMYRLESLPARGLLARLSDAFSGCGRSGR